MNKIKFKINLTSKQSSYADISDHVIKVTADEPEYEKTEIYTEGTLTVSSDGTYCLCYDESELTGMEECSTNINFNENSRGFVTLLREGEYKTALIFESGHRHICVYHTPYMPFEMCIDTKKLENTISVFGGRLYIEYSIETNGMRCEMTKLTLECTPIK